MHEQNMAILKGLVSVAWADGHVAEEEKEVIDALLQAFNASPSETKEIHHYASAPKKLEDIPLTELSFDDRRVLLQHAVLLTWIDGEQQEKEQELIERLCHWLNIPAVEAKGLIAAAETRAKSFLNLD